MKIREGFILKEIADTFVVVPVGDNMVDFSLMITINETGAFLWNCLSEDKTRDDLADALMSEYEGATREEMLEDIDAFTSLLEENNILE